MNIYVGNLPYNITEDQLKSHFDEHGEVAKVTIITDKFSGRSKGFGFVEMPVDSEAEKAIQSLDGSDVEGRNIRVNQARPRPQARAR